MDNKSEAQTEKVEPLKRMYSVEELAEYLGLSPRTIYNGLTKNCKKPFPIRPKRIGKLVKFDLKDIEKYIASL